MPGFTLLAVAVITFGVFSLTKNSALVCTILMVPIALLGFVRGWIAGALVALVAALLVFPYFGSENTLVHPALTVRIWAMLSVGYLSLGILTGLRGDNVRKTHQRLVAEMEAKLERAQASAERYEALLEEMSQGQERLMRVNEELALLNGIATAVNSSLEMAQIIDTTMSNLGALLRVDALHLYWADATESFTLEAARPALPESAPPPRALRGGEGLIDRLQHAQGAVSMCLDGPDAALRPPAMASEVSCLIAVPLRMGARLQGMLVLGRTAPEEFSADDAGFLESLARVLALAIENARLFKRAQEMSLSDELTGLGNRRMFNLRLTAELSRTRATGAPLCLVIFDLDFFKRINDQYGHPAGDQVLKQFARMALQDIRGSDAFCRIGGEEFALLIPDAILLEAYAIGQRICRRLGGTPLTLEDGTTFPMTVSAGIACMEGAIQNADDLVAAADRALYAAKQNGRNRVEVFTADMTLPAPEEVSVNRMEPAEAADPVA